MFVPRENEKKTTHPKKNFNFRYKKKGREERKTPKYFKVELEVKISATIS